MRACRRYLLLLFLAWPLACGAAAMSVDEVKASYVLNFVRFTDWPASVAGNGKLTLCVVGDESLGKVLARLDGRRIKERTLRVLASLRYGDELNDCQVVVVGEAERLKAASIIKDIGNAPVLTISSIEGFAEKGGCIGLLYRENRMLFEINLEALRSKKLQLPAQVLNLAANVFGR